MVCRYAFLFLLIPPDLPQSDKSAIHFVALCCAFNISRLTAFFNAETKSLALFTYCPEFFLQFAYQFLPAGFFLRLCRACMAAGLFPPLLCRFSARKTHLKKKVKKQLTKAFLHDRINKSSGEGHKKVNMGVFPSGQWGQTVNLLLSASVVRIHPRPPKNLNV